MATNTYVALKTTTVTGSPAASVTIDTIPQGYTDLVVVADVSMSSPSGTTYIVGRVGNGTIDTNSNYSSTVMVGNGSSATSYRTSSVNYFQCDTYITGSNRAMFQVNIQSYSNTSINKTIIGRTSSAATNTSAITSLWRSNSAIDTIRFYDFTGNNFAVGSTFTIYGVSNVGASSPKATGGDVYSDANYWYHAFPMSGNFTPAQALTADVLVVAGGGGGGNSPAAGAGGAGGVLAYSSQSLTSGANYQVLIGAGGAGGTADGVQGASGGNSQFGSLTASTGGGGGGAYGIALTGGSGGGGGYFNGTNNGAGYPGAAGTSGQGSAGGQGWATSGNHASGGGGGAGGTGGNASTGGIGGTGGAGVNTYTGWGSLSAALTATGYGVSGYIAGGGGGTGWTTRGTASAGGGAGNQGVSAGSGSNGAAYSGGGGGGSTYAVGGNGGSGIVIVRYAK